MRSSVGVRQGRLLLDFVLRRAFSRGMRRRGLALGNVVQQVVSGRVILLFLALSGCGNSDFSKKNQGDASGAAGLGGGGSTGGSDALGGQSGSGGSASG